MAVTSLTGKFIPAIFDPYFSLTMLEEDRLLQSGAAVRGAEADAFLVGPGSTITLPFWNQLADEAANISSDDSTSSSTPKALTSGKMIAIRQSLNQSWSSMDLVGDYVGSDPMDVVRLRVQEYWRARREARAIASLVGVLADNVANDSSDMLNNISVTTGTPADANKFSGDAYVDTMATMGDKIGMLSVLFVHSVVYSRMYKLDMIDTVKDSLGHDIKIYNGARVIVSDSCPASGTPTVYTSFLLGPGSFQVGIGSPKVPSEIDRTPAAGDGGGQETFYSRTELIVHPKGMQFTSGSLAGKSPTVAELQAAANWDRVHERKRVPIAFMKTNG